MKRLFYTISIFFLATLTIQAQRIQVGPMLGFNVSNILIDESFSIDDVNYEFSTLKSGTGVMVGSFVQFTYNDFFLQPQFMFSQNQSHINFSTDFESKRQRMTVHQIQLPVMMGYEVNDNFKLYAGPMVSRFVDASLTPTNQDMFASYTDNMDKTTLGYQIGFGVTLDKATFSLQMRDGVEENGIAASFKSNLLNFRQQDRVIQFAFSYNIVDKKMSKEEPQPQQDIFFTPDDITVSVD